jgi:ActR/RegA family two-component response regulator
LVDGDAVYAMHLEAALRHVGWDVVGPAGRLSDAARLAEVEPLDAAVLDVQIGEESGFSVAERLAAREVPFVLVSAYTGVLPGRLASAPLLSKPCRVAQVLAALDRLRPEEPKPSGGDSSD